MQQLHALYHHEIPSFLQAAADTPAMQRLKDIGMSCGCQYTAFPLFDPICAYSRFDHSLGTALILWHFTQDEKQALAGLFHDIAAPVFSHTVDFVYGDKDTQEFTEGRTRQIIQDSPEIQEILASLGLTTDDVCDYHIYPLADNESPRLSADRLEYTFGNLLHYGLSRLGVLKFYYNQINVQMNEKNEPEFVFQSPDYASVFSHLAIQTSRVYICEECRYTMEFLSRLIKTAIQKQVLTEDDLWTTESQVIGKLKEDPETNLLFTQLCGLSDLTITDKPLNSSSIQTPSKRRFIDPLVPGYGRVSEFDAKYASQIYELQHINFDVWMTPNFL